MPRCAAFAVAEVRDLHFLLMRDPDRLDSVCKSS